MPKPSLFISAFKNVILTAIPEYRQTDLVSDIGADTVNGVFGVTKLSPKIPITGNIPKVGALISREDVSWAWVADAIKIKRIKRTISFFIILNFDYKLLYHI